MRKELNVLINWINVCFPDSTTEEEEEDMMQEGYISEPNQPVQVCPRAGYMSEGEAGLFAHEKKKIKKT